MPQLLSRLWIPQCVGRARASSWMERPTLPLPWASGGVNGDQNPRKDGAKGKLGSLSSAGRAAPDERLS